MKQLSFFKKGFTKLFQDNHFFIQLNQKDKRTRRIEEGRSMVEILGVLAIVGVLSVGGIMGYRYAMDKYRANDIVNEVNLRNRDTWNMYQTKDLPDEDELDTWPAVTQSGFPIGVYPRSNVIFDVQVDGVPSRVCEQVLNMNLEGPLFIWTPNGGGKAIYNGTNAREVCGEDGTTSSMVFTTTLESFGNAEGLRGDLTDERGQPMRYCLSDEDCRGCERCGGAYTCEATCPDDKPICMQKEGNEAKCVECELTNDCSRGQICDDTTYTCQPVPEKCAEGEFRSKNGACVPCNEPTNIIISSEKFTAPGIEDALTGEEMCAACATATTNQTARNMETDKAGRKYCSYGCTKGVSFQTLDGSCAPCYDENGEPNTEMYRVASDRETIAQCTACPGRVWGIFNIDGLCMYDPFGTCPEGTFRQAYGNYYSCIPCDQAGTVSFLNGNTTMSDWVKRQNEMCNSCHIEGVWSTRRVLYSGGGRNCMLLCQQPDEESEESTICATDPKNAKCKRQFLSGDGKCFPCDEETSVFLDKSRNSYLVDLCEKCGRKVNEYNYCVLKKDKCPIGTVLGTDDQCHSCAGTKSIDIRQEGSGCEENCRVKSWKSDGAVEEFYGPDDDPEVVAAAEPGRWFRKTSKNSYSCMRKCPSGRWQRGDGACFRCDSNEPGEGGLLFEGRDESDNSLAKICEQCSPEREAGIACQLKDCSATLDLGTTKYKYIHENYGRCVKCSDTRVNIGMNGEDSRSPAECENCGNRFFLPSSSCILVDPGTTGICNSVQDIPETLDSDLKNESKPYLDGKYDGQLFMDGAGYCRSCDDKKKYTATVAQCKSCGNRRYEGGNCVYGLCTEKVTFLNTNNSCVACSNTDRVEIDNTDTARRLCEACEEKRVMTAIDKTYCVADCAPGQWQDINGKCRSDNTVSAEIGSDETSRRLCRDAGHIAYSKSDAEEKTHWYCSQAPRANAFININGANTNCTAERTEIPNTQDAKNLCLGEYEDDLGCVSVERSIETDDAGRVYCVK